MRHAGSPVFGAGASDGAQSQVFVRSSGDFAVPAARQRVDEGSPTSSALGWLCLPALKG